MNWLNYSQYVLEQVSFDRRLFRKELRKFLRLLPPMEQTQLLRWCRSRTRRSRQQAVQMA
ncbi:hypothetical protein [Spirosoma montaniterrae]|uniref:Uncharacterized protein n=1 Tax=Spirosoma montaniterrae TaxID=1178516 RepID=A0A1P9WXF2_9BACT|nr:hypothetical protein [Spirosoma montaniterrae]AQG80064.1 hypothetical protein AWR27_12450 [Spirosoma montaniterrae]